MKGFLAVIVAACVALCMLLAKWNLNFQADGFWDNSRFLSLRGDKYSYSQIDHVYYKPNRVNGYGETIDRPSYVLVLRNGEQIDLYEHGEIEDYADQLLAFLEEKGVAVKGKMP